MQESSLKTNQEVDPSIFRPGYIIETERGYNYNKPIKQGF